MVDFTLLEKIVNSNTVFNIGKDKKVIYEETGILRDNIEAQIINPESNFVVVTYWWGRGRDNANIARPCMAYYESVISVTQSWPMSGINRESEFGTACRMPDGRWNITETTQKGWW